MIKVLVIGVGSIGQRHIRSLMALGVNKIAALRTGRGFAKKLPSEFQSVVREFYDEKKAIAWQPTHVIISNPTSMHLLYVEKIIEMGIRIFVEKPLFSSFSEYKESQILKHTNYSNLLTVGYCLRFHGLFREIKKIINEKRYGKPIFAAFNVGSYLPDWHKHEDYRISYAARKDLGGGVLRTLSHELDLVQYFFGNITHVLAKVEKLSSLEIDVDDCVDAILKTKECSRIYIHMDYLIPGIERSGRILFSEGKLEYNYVQGIITFTRYRTDTQQIYKTDEDYNKQYILQIKDFLNDNVNTACDLIQGVHTLEVIEQCENSSIERREICLN